MPKRWTRWSSSICVEQVNVAWRPSKSSTADDSTSVPNVGSRRTAADDGGRLAAEQPPGDVDRVAPDVHHRAAAVRGDVADVPGVEVAVGEERLDRLAARRSRRPATNSWTRVHSGWTRYMNASISRTPAARQPSIISAASAALSAERLLAEHVLAGRGRPQRPLGVQVVGQRDVHRLDVGVGKQRRRRSRGAAAMPSCGPWRPPGRGHASAMATTSHRPTAAWPGSPCARRWPRSRARPSARGGHRRSCAVAVSQRLSRAGRRRSASDRRSGGR